VPAARAALASAVAGAVAATADSRLRCPLPGGVRRPHRAAHRSRQPDRNAGGWPPARSRTPAIVGAMPTLAPPELTAPFAPGGEAAIDAVLAQRLLAWRSSPAATTADLYFEYRVTADYALQEEKVKSVGRGITLGLGVRVTKGDATGYAFTEDLAWERMAPRRAHRRPDRHRRRPRPAGRRARGDVARLLPGARLSLIEPPADKLALLVRGRQGRARRRSRASSRSRRRWSSRSRRCWSSAPTAGWPATSSR
jgi:hypothetical protein